MTMVSFTDLRSVVELLELRSVESWIDKNQIQWSSNVHPAVPFRDRRP